jgi:hypothetical protein
MGSQVKKIPEKELIELLVKAGETYDSANKMVNMTHTIVLRTVYEMGLAAGFSKGYTEGGNDERME